MKVFPELSKNAWIVLLALAEQPCQASQIAKKTGLKLNRISEALDQLEECSIIKERKRKSTLILDSQLKNTLKQLSAEYNKERLVDSFEGKKLNALFQILDGYDTITKLKLVTDYSAPTLKRITSNLQKNLFVFQPNKGNYSPRDTFKPRIKLLYVSFFGYFSDFLEKQGIVWKKISAFGNNVLIESNQAGMPGFVRTGFSRFHEHNVQLFLTDKNYFVSGDRNPTREEIFVHALAVSKKDYRHIMYCTLYADLNKMKLKQLKNLPTIFRIENEAKQIFEYLSSKGGSKTKDDFMTPYNEYLDVRRNYERN
jgi:hypothetical protein